MFTHWFIVGDPTLAKVAKLAIVRFPVVGPVNEDRRRAGEAHE